MKFIFAFAILAAATATGALASLGGNLTTVVVTALTTYCPFATELTHNGVVYTITAETTLTITDCPCTVTQPLIITPSTVLYTSCAEYAPETAPTMSYVLPTLTRGNVVASGTGSVVVPSRPVMYTGAAAGRKVGGGVLVVLFWGLVAGIGLFL